MQRYEVEWADGVVTPLMGLKQYGTYANLMEGIPTHKSNELFHTEPLVNPEGEARGLLLWAPQNRVEGWPETYMSSPTAALPAVTCIATFRHFLPARDQEMQFSDVTVAWFQEEWTLPIIPEVLAKIRALAWRDVAIDYDW